MREFMARRRSDQAVEVLIEAHECNIIGPRRRRQHRFRDLGKFAALLLYGAFGSKARR
jgi:hypothetical protein